MDTQQLTELYENITRLQAEGKASEAESLLLEHLKQLPESLQTEIMLEMYTDSLEREAAGLALKREIQEEGLAAAKVLQAIQKELRKGQS
jgi:hypothetical protein